MAETRVDVTALHGALDRARASKDLSWRELARQIGVSASTMSRLAQGQNPDINAFARMVRWLNVQAEAFIVEDGRPVNAPGEEEEEPELIAQLAPLLRARKDLGERDVQLLEDLISSAVRRFRADQSPTKE
jgi:transcriptional regulator with XRE-family HTH domain